MRLPRALLASGVVVGLVVGGAVAGCQLVDPASTLDRDWDAADAGTIEDASTTTPGARCYVDVIDEHPIYDYCPSGQVCCYSGSPLGTGGCQGAACGNLSFACSSAAQCPSNQVCCAGSGLQGDYLVLQGSSCADTCTANGDLVLCDVIRSPGCPGGMKCHTNGVNQVPLGYDSCM